MSDSKTNHKYQGERPGEPGNRPLAEAGGTGAPVQPQQPEEPDLSHPADAADHMMTLPLAERIQLVEGLNVHEAAASIAEMNRHDQAELLKGMDTALTADILTEMDPDDAADVLEELGEPLKQHLLRRVDDEQAADISHLLTYEPDTAGGVITTYALVLDEKLNADQAIHLVRQQAADKEVPYYAYLVDDDEVLTGVLSMRDLLLAKPGVRLGQLVESQSLVTTTYDMDREEVAHLIAHYNFLALPVVDYEDRLLGVVTVDDIIDIIHEEASEDLQKMVGAGSDETTDSPWSYSVKKRLPWLVVNVLNSAIAAYVVSVFEGTIAQMAFLAVLMPIVANQAGNTGQQALAVMIRQLAMDKFDRRRSWLAVWREVKIGVVNGALIAIVVLAAVAAVTGNPPLASITAAALFWTCWWAPWLARVFRCCSRSWAATRRSRRPYS